MEECPGPKLLVEVTDDGADTWSKVAVTLFLLMDGKILAVLFWLASLACTAVLLVYVVLFSQLSNYLRLSKQPEGIISLFLSSSLVTSGSFIRPVHILCKSSSS